LLLFVEQLLALSNSRKVDTHDEGVERITQHVRRLRCVDGEVHYCRRQHYNSHWAEAAERNGNVVNLTAFLPGASQRTLALNFMNNHVASYKPMRLARIRQCITDLEEDLTVKQAYIPLAGLLRVLPSLRNGVLFALVAKIPGLEVSHVGFLEKRDGVVNAIHAAEGEGVIRNENCASYAERVKNVIVLKAWRSRPYEFVNRP